MVRKPVSNQIRFLLVNLLTNIITGGTHTSKTNKEAMIFETINGEFSPNKKRITTFSSPPPVNAVKILANGRFANSSEKPNDR